ncbi:MAG: DegT/DnrJ/EryC1/StrS family aminotransferase [Pirellulales bacterium]|nr:DegT/DnrJ/EryC1/StrS family aminotransferase [Pirellulales bacterium]
MSSSESATARNASESKPKKNVPLLDIRGENEPLREEILGAIADVYDSGAFVLGPEVKKLEEEIAAYSHAKHAVGCASGSDALMLALMALDVGPQDQVILPSYTFFATAGAVWRLGARPVFVDILPEDFNLDPEQLEAAITPATKAIIPVHLFGQCADMDAICEIANRHGLPIIEDAAQSIGAEYRGRRTGSLGDIGCFSFYPTKNLGGLGDAGMLTTNDDELADKLQLLRGHGMRPRYYHKLVGVNSRIDSIQAAALRVKLKRLDEWSQQRAENADRYYEKFCEHGLEQVLGLPSESTDKRHVWNQYIVRIPDGRRDALREHLTNQGIGSEIYYPVALHRQQCFDALGYEKGSLPVTEQATEETVALPISPGLTADDQQRVVDQIARFISASAKISHAA